MASMTSGRDSISKVSDEEQWSNWMVQAQQGDEASYRMLLEVLGRVIESYLRRRFGSLEFLEDVVQESLLGIHQARHTYQVGRPFTPWLFAIVRYKAIDMLRRQKVQKLFVTNSGTDENDQSGSTSQEVSSPGADALLESEQLFHGIKRKSRQALVLTKVLGLTIQEAAESLGVSEAAMKLRVHRALRELKAQMEFQ